MAITRVTTDAFEAAGNKVGLRQFLEHLRTKTTKQDVFDWRVKLIRPALDRAKFPDRFHVLVVCDGEDGEEVAGCAQWVNG